jgi:hypothetical protein
MKQRLNYISGQIITTSLRPHCDLTIVIVSKGKHPQDSFQASELLLFTQIHEVERGFQQTHGGWFGHSEVENQPQGLKFKNGGWTNRKLRVQRQFFGLNWDQSTRVKLVVWWTNMWISSWKHRHVMAFRYWWMDQWKSADAEPVWWKYLRPSRWWKRQDGNAVRLQPDGRWECH